MDFLWNWNFKQIEENFEEEKIEVFVTVEKKSSFLRDFEIEVVIDLTYSAKLNDKKITKKSGSFSESEKNISENRIILRAQSLPILCFWVICVVFFDWVSDGHELSRRDQKQPQHFHRRKQGKHLCCRWFCSQQITFIVLHPIYSAN